MHSGSARMNDTDVKRREETTTSSRQEGGYLCMHALTMAFSGLRHLQGPESDAAGAKGSAAAPSLACRSFRDRTCSHPLAPASASADRFPESFTRSSASPQPPIHPQHHHQTLLSPPCLLPPPTSDDCTLYDLSCHCYAYLHGRMTKDYAWTAPSIEYAAQETSARRCR